MRRRYALGGRLALRFVLIDRLIELEPGKRAAAAMTFPAQLEIFSDHFPGKPIVPGVLLTEAMGQTAGWLLAATVDFERWPMLVLIEHAKFRRLVRPNEALRLNASVRTSAAETFAVDAEAIVGSERVATARLVFQAFTISDDERGPLIDWARRTFDRLGGRELLRAPFREWPSASR